MPLARPLPDIQRELRESLTDELKAVLDRLQALLPENATKQDEILLLLGRYNDARRLERQGVATGEEVRLIENQLRRDLLTFINELTEADFDADAQKNKPGGAKQGMLLYQVPHLMTLDEETRCIVRIALDRDVLYEDLKIIDHTEERLLKKISKTMQVELADPSGGRNFSIRSTSKAVQTIDLEGDEYTEWRFYVTPLREGQYLLEVKVAVIELVDGEKELRERVLEEEVQIISRNAAPAAATTPDTPFKTAGEALAFAPAADLPLVESTRQLPEAPQSVVNIPQPQTPKPPNPQTPKPQTSTPPNPKSGKGLRAAALFLALLMFSTATTWAVTPDATRAWWKTRYLQDTPEAYETYIQQYEQSPHREKAVYRKAVKTEAPPDIRRYQTEYVQGEYKAEIKQLREKVELEYLNAVEQNPDTANIRRFIADFPDSERLPQLKKAVERRPEVARLLLPALENAYIESLRLSPTEKKVRQFVADFPQSGQVARVAQTVQAYADVADAVLPALNQAVLNQAEKNGDAEPVRQYLQTFSDSSRLKTFKQALEQKPGIRQQVQAAVRQTEARVAEIRAMSAAERQAWETALKQNTAKAFADFVTQYPKSVKRDEAREKVQQLKPAVTPQEQAWADASALHTPQAYIYFVQKYPKSRHTTEARQRIKTFSLSIKDQKRLETEAAARLEAEQEAERQRLVQQEAQRKAAAAETQNPSNQKPSNPEPSNQKPSNPSVRSGLIMVPVQGGTFTMGCQDGRDKVCNDNEKPAHLVTLSAFQIGKYEVTQADWRAVMGTNSSYFKNCDDCPVEQVSWNDIQDFLQKLNAKYPGKNYRLPTEAEWEYAARGGHKMPNDVSLMTAYPGGNDIGKVAWYDDNSGLKTHPVGKKAPNALGLYDMSGNVFEWCSDWYGDYPAGAQTNPKGPKSGFDRVFRGGFWGYLPHYCRPASRFHKGPDNRVDNLGFRLAAFLQ